jgi:hypothetical protein
MAKRLPVLVDTSMHTAFAIKYAIYAMFGFLAATFGSETLEVVAGDATARVIGAFICLFSTVAAVAVAHSATSVDWEKVELYATIAVVSFVSVYCTFATWLVLLGDNSRVALAMIAAALVVFPSWRIIQIIKRLRG